MKFRANMSLLFIAAAMVASVNVFAASGTVTLPYTNGFELSDSVNYTVGYPIEGDPGWSVAYSDTNAGVVTNWPDWNSAHPSPFAFLTHSNVLNVAGTVSNIFTAGSPDFAYIDVCIKPQLRDSPPNDPELIGGGPEGKPVPQAVAYINSQSNLVFYYRWVDYSADPNGYLPPTWATNTWVTISTSDWVRLTFEMAYKGYGEDPYSTGYYGGDSFYRIRINNNATTNYFTNENSYALTFLIYLEPWGSRDPYDPAPTPREWFMCANSQQNYNTLNSFSISGSAQVDDLAVVPNPVVSVNSTNVTEGALDSNMVFTVTLNDVCPADTILDFKTVDGSAAAGLDYVGTNGTITIPAGQLTQYITVVVNGSRPPNGPTDFQMQLRRQNCPNDFWTSPAIGVGTILESAATYTTHGTPTLWLDSYNLTNGLSGGDLYEVADTNDFDEDGMLNWQEYWAGTNPKDSTSLLKIVALSTNRTVTWIGGPSNDVAAANPWWIYRSTNLVGANPDAVWTVIPPTNQARSVDGTNSWTDTDGSTYGPRVFYKVTTTTNRP